MTQKTLGRIETTLIIVGAIAAALAAYMHIDAFLIPEEASEKLRGATGTLAIATLIALVSIPVGNRSFAGGFILRCMTTFSVSVSFVFLSGIGRYLAVCAIIAFFLALVFLMMRYFDEVENRSTSRL